MHTSIVVMLAALACLAKASPVSLLDTAAANNGTASPQWGRCPSQYVSKFIKVDQRDVPYRFDVGAPFWAEDELACSEASLGAGYRGSVYRRDSKLCFMKDFRYRRDLYIQQGDQTRLENYDIPEYDTTSAGPYDLTVREFNNGRVWYKAFPYCEVCTLMVKDRYMPPCPRPDRN